MQCPELIRIMSFSRPCNYWNWCHLNLYVQQNYFSNFFLTSEIQITLNIKLCKFVLCKGYSTLFFILESAGLHLSELLNVNEYCVYTETSQPIQHLYNYGFSICIHFGHIPVMPRHSQLLEFYENCEMVVHVQFLTSSVTAMNIIVIIHFQCEDSYEFIFCEISLCTAKTKD